MGLALTTLYLVTAFCSVETIFGPLAQCHVELIIAMILILVSIPALSESFLFKTTQVFAIVGISLAVLCSVLMTGWFGGAFKAFVNFLPNAFAYCLVVLYCKSKRALQWVILSMLFAALLAIASATWQLRHIDAYYEAEMAGNGRPTGPVYLIVQKNDAGQVFFRIRGQNFLNDPNDFGQFLICLIPLQFFFWRDRKLVRNVFFVLLPVCLLLYGAFLTHSRGFLIALAAVLLVAMRKKLGLPLSVALSVLLFAGAMRMNFTGGREVSADAGADRIDLWSGGLQALKSHPLFGVGFQRLPDYQGLTAHNSVVVCAAEVGIVGLFFWCCFLLPSVRDVLVTANVRGGTLSRLDISHEDTPSLVSESATLDATNVAWLGRLVFLSLVGFFVSGMFLSRAFTMTLFLLGGMAETVYQLGVERGLVAPRLRVPQVVLYAGVLAVVLVSGMYVLLRVFHLLHMA